MGDRFKGPKANTYKAYLGKQKIISDAKRQKDLIQEYLKTHKQWAPHRKKDDERTSLV